MVFPMVELKKQVSQQFLAILNRALSFCKKQERNGKSPSCCSPTRHSDAVHPISSGEKREIHDSSVVGIPDDMVEEILHRLPLRSLMGLRRVSKGWKSLIQSQHLADKHIRLRHENYGAEEMKISIEWYYSKSLRIRFYKPGETNAESSDDLLRIVGSCNGLVCIYDQVFVYVLNPVTCVVRTLTPPRSTLATLVGGTKLSVGFGRDVVRGRYKVVVLYNDDDDDDNKVVKARVFDLSTGKWRRRRRGRFNECVFVISCERKPVFVNGSLFWLSASPHNHSEMLVMDLHTEKLRTLSLPDEILVSWSWSGSIDMWCLKDRLCLSSSSQELRVWVLAGSERWERRDAYSDNVILPLTLNSAWFSPSLVSPYQFKAEA